MKLVVLVFLGVVLVAMAMDEKQKRWRWGQDASMISRMSSPQYYWFRNRRGGDMCVSSWEKCEFCQCSCCSKKCLRTWTPMQRGIDVSGWCVPDDWECDVTENSLLAKCVTTQ
ncbi:Hypp7108 [Branchiostoma lanceolatum]|uniref:Hypp7108 protein n=1 Tax=Branchiostoma lanceolatum TaxID=7740 RepID=A0A8J9YXK7_BRALA|nr:Hypp7108 [Branchiostoma lanceolatum]